MNDSPRLTALSDLTITASSGTELPVRADKSEMLASAIGFLVVGLLGAIFISGLVLAVIYLWTVILRLIN